jgi:hypothetical protein
MKDYTAAQSSNTTKETTSVTSTSIPTNSEIIHDYTQAIGLENEALREANIKQELDEVTGWFYKYKKKQLSSHSI